MQLVDLLKKLKNVVVVVNKQLTSQFDINDRDIVHLHIYSESFIFVNENCVGDLKNLEELTIDGVQFGNYNFLSSAQKIKYLVINNAKLKSIPFQVNNLRSLKTVDFSKNKISQLDTIEWGKLSKVEHLNLSVNKLLRLPSSFIWGASVTDLALSGNPLTSISIKTSRIDTKLMTLDLSNTLISELPPNLKMLTELKRLDLSNTLITKIPLSVLELNNLMQLQMEGLTLSDMDIKTVKKMSLSLKTLYLQFCTMRTVPNWVKLCPHIMELHLEYTELEYLPEWLEKFEFLKYVYIQNTPLEKVYSSKSQNEFINANWEIVV